MKDITNDMKLVQLLFFIQNNAQVKSSKNISIAAQYTTLHEYFSHPSSVFFVFFPTAAIKLKLGLQIGGRILMATDVDGSNYVVNEQPGVRLCSAFY